VEIPDDYILSDRYQILDHIGTGGMADIYHARDLNLQREVAIKLLRDSLIEDPSFQARFLQEARSAANLVHPNIVTIFDFGYDADRYYIIMEYVPGTDLKKLLERRGVLPTAEALDIMAQACSGIGYAHRAGLVHCDVKPQNILVRIDGRVKITDFGIARALALIQADEQAETVWGSPFYLSPEQAAGKPPSPASDVYALGITFYEMLAGKPPFDGKDFATLVMLHQTASPPSLLPLNPEIPEALDQIIQKVLSKEPSARYRTADQLGRVLTSFLDESLNHTTRPPEQSQSISDQEPYPPPQEPSTAAAHIDWLAVALGLLTFIAIGGLIPLWLWVCLRYPICPFNAW
jgi:serine/threonine protein kinase